MSVRNLNWYNLQATRRYPLDDSASGESDAGVPLPNDILVDMHLRFPAVLGEYCYMQGVTISAGIVTLLFGVAASLDEEGATIAAVSLPKPVAPNIHYPVQDLSGGVAGWVVFGVGVQTAFAGRYPSPRHTLLAKRCARAYRPLPIVDIGKLNVGTALSNEVTMTATAPLTIVPRQIIADGKQVTALIFQLDQNDASLSYNPLSYFLGSCGQRPESGTCPKEPIETINGVSPDCDGNINIQFENLVGENFVDCGGIDLLTPLSLAQVCAGSAYDRPVFYKDLCCPAEVEDVSARDQLPVASLKVGAVIKTLSPDAKYWKVISIVGETVTWEETTETDAICGWPDPTAVIPADVILNISAVQDYPTLELPVCIDFCSCGPSPLFDVRRGVFEVQKTTAPFGCAPCSESTDEPENIEDRTAVYSKNTYAAIDSSSLNIATLKNTASDWAFGKTITVQLKIGSAGLDRNGGVIINYHHEPTNGTTQIRYLAAVLDVSRGQLRLLRYINNTFSVEAQEFLNVKTNVWYALAITVIFNGTNVAITVAAQDLSGNSGATINTTISPEQYGTPMGAAGLYANRSFTYFNRLTITE
jgi:hypothetical protein